MKTLRSARKPPKTEVSAGISLPETTADRIRAIKIGRKPKGMPHSVRVAQMAAETRLNIFRKSLQHLSGDTFVIRFIVQPKEFERYHERVCSRSCDTHEKIFNPHRTPDELSEKQDESDDGETESEIAEIYGGYDYEAENERKGLTTEEAQERRFFATLTIIHKDQMDRIKGSVQILLAHPLKKPSFLLSTTIDYGGLKMLLQGYKSVRRKDFERLLERMDATCDKILIMSGGSNRRQHRKYSTRNEIPPFQCDFYIRPDVESA